MACPMIHQITDKSPFPAGQQCPFGHTDSGLGELGEALTEESYKKLKKVMAQITLFYENGTNLKKGHYDQVCAELSRLHLDMEMCQKQISALESSQAIKEHPKSKEYREKFNTEMENFSEQKAMYDKKKEENYDLWQWSTVIVKVCLWLQASLDFHCKEKLKLDIEVEEPPPLSEKEIEQYSKGLDEISYNLQESQDFFKASVDGRLKQYHEVEKALIEAQLDLLSQYADENPRRTFWESEFIRDLEYVNGNLSDDVEKTTRRQKMLQNHAAFLAVLKFHKEKLSHPFQSSSKREYDPKFDFNPAAVIAEHGNA